MLGEAPDGAKQRRLINVTEPKSMGNRSEGASEELNSLTCVKIHKEQIRVEGRVPNHALGAPICSNDHLIGILGINSAGQTLIEGLVIINLRQCCEKRNRCSESCERFPECTYTFGRTVDNSEALISRKIEGAGIVETVPECSVFLARVSPIRGIEYPLSPMGESIDTGRRWRNDTRADSLASNAKCTSGPQRLFTMALTNRFCW